MTESKLSRLTRALRDPDYIGPAHHFKHDAEVILTSAYLQILQEPEDDTQTLTIRVDAADLLGRVQDTTGLFVEIVAERERQDEQWGGPAHDDTREPFDWLNYIQHQVDNATAAMLDEPETDKDPADYRQRLVKIAALAVAAMQSHDRLLHGEDIPAESEPEGPPPFGKRELLAMLDDALPESAAFRAVVIEYWGSLTEKDEAGLDNIGRAMKALREYLPDKADASLSLGAMDGMLTLSAKA